MSGGASTVAGRRRATARAARPATAKSARKAPPRGPRKPPPKAARKSRVRKARARKVGVVRRVRSWGSLRRRIAVALVLATALAIGYFAWFRDSSLVGVSHVTIDGLGGSGAKPAAAALTSAAEGMTTLDVDQGRLDAVAARFPQIASVSADAQFPHGLTVHVIERPPAMIARDGSHSVGVAADGTLLTGVPAPSGTKLPTLRVHSLPAAGRLGGQPLEEALVLGATPPPLRPEIADVSVGDARGVTVTLRGGIDLRFGSSSQAAQKWAAAAAVLADKRLTTLAYIDVRVPQRPAVGGAG